MIKDLKPFSVISLDKFITVILKFLEFFLKSFFEILNQ